MPAVPGRGVVTAPRIFLVPLYRFGGAREQVPGAQQRPCTTCSRTVTATPTSYEPVDADPRNVFLLCDDCGEEVRRRAPRASVLRAPGADDELRAAGLDDVVATDRLLLQRMKARES